MEKLNLLMLFGGNSPEHEISKISADTVLKHLSEERYHVIPVYITREGKWLLYDGTIDHIKNIAWEKFGTSAVLSPDRVNGGLLRIVGSKVKTIPVDVVFPVLHGRNGEDGTIQGLCDLAGIPCVGCGLLSSAVCMDKVFMKTIAAHIGLKQAKYLGFNSHELADRAAAAKEIRYKLGYPCFIKPARAGSSVGMTMATNKKELLAGIDEALSVDNRIVVEKAVKGREFECGVIGDSRDIRITMPGEVVYQASFYDHNAKYHDNESKTLIPAPIPEEQAQLMMKMAGDIFKATDGRGYARVDFFMDEKENIIFNEINTVPGFTSISMFHKLWEASGVPLSDMLDKFVEIAIRGDA